MTKQVRRGLAALCLLMLGGCSGVGDTTTDHARNYVYGAGETIHFYDEQHDRQLQGTLTFETVRVLSDRAFTLKERDGTDESGNPLYKEVTYQQIVQIEYVYEKTDAGRELDDSRFTVRDAGGGGALPDPDTSYEAVPTDKRRLIVALRQPGDRVRVEVLYAGWITPNAIVELAVPAASDATSVTTGSSETAAATASTLSDDEILLSQLEAQRNPGRELKWALAVAVTLVLVLAAVCMLLWYGRERKPE